MKIIKPLVEILEQKSAVQMLKNIERAGRTCYKSELRITENSYMPFINNIIKRGHESVLEHEKITCKIICDRGVSHEIVRHRIASYSQESTRYVNYKEGIEVIEPCFWKDENGKMTLKDLDKYELWRFILEQIERVYKDLIEGGATPQEARSVLPNSLKTEIIMTANLREWRHFFKVRCPKSAHPQIREIAFMLLKKFKEYLPIVFDDMEEQ